MINTDVIFSTMVNSPVRQIKARVELYEGSALLDVFKHSGALQSFSIERVGEESKFFGFGICQKLTVKLLDRERKINNTTKNSLEAVFGVGSDYIYAYPMFYVTEVKRDENTNTLSVTAYDALYKANQATVAELYLKSSVIKLLSLRTAT
jgi:hypothetical protein